MSRPTDTEIFDEPEEANDPQLTELVAYLDGELSEEASNRLERQLAENPPLRGYAETLDRTWQLLDTLGEATASGEFTQKTLASLSAISHEEFADQMPSSKRGTDWVRKIPATRIVLWTLAGFLGSSVGLLLGRSSQSPKADSEDVQLLQQLDLLLQFPRLHAARSATFLEQVTAIDHDSSEDGSDAMPEEGDRKP
jgi:anti-sigma factor RsiW